VENSGCRRPTRSWRCSFNSATAVSRGEREDGQPGILAAVYLQFGHGGEPWRTVSAGTSEMTTDSAFLRERSSSKACQLGAATKQDTANRCPIRVCGSRAVANLNPIRKSVRCQRTPSANPILAGFTTRALGRVMRSLQRASGSASSPPRFAGSGKSLSHRNREANQHWAV
jgi:hypothetical protein